MISAAGLEVDRPLTSRAFSSFASGAGRLPVASGPCQKIVGTVWPMIQVHRWITTSRSTTRVRV